jgi:hypothetical protein
MPGAVTDSALGQGGQADIHTVPPDHA